MIDLHAGINLADYAASSAVLRVTSVAAGGPLLRRRSGPPAATGYRKGRWPQR
jgi:hypothetical protein